MPCVLTTDCEQDLVSFMECDGLESVLVGDLLVLWLGSPCCGLWFCRLLSSMASSHLSGLVSDEDCCSCLLFSVKHWCCEVVPFLSF